MAEVITHFEWDAESVDPAPDGPKLDLVFRPRVEETAAWRNWLLIALIYRFYGDFRACLPSGALVRLHPHVLHWDGVEGYWSSPNYVSEYSRTTFPEIYGARLWLAEIPFYGLDPRTGCIVDDKCPELAAIAGAQLCLPEYCFLVPLEDFARWLVSEIGKLEMAANTSGTTIGAPDMVNLIVNAFTSGRVKTKAEAYRLFAKGMKHEVWRTYWREACLIMPELSKPGPR